MNRPQGHHPAAHKGTTPETHGKARDPKMDDAPAPKSKETANKKQQESVHAEKDPEIDEFKKHEGKVDVGEKQKMKKDADEDVPDGPNADDKRKALFAAKVITKSNDKANSPLALLMTELQALRKIFKGVPLFRAKPLRPNVWQISMNPEVEIFDNSTNSNNEASRDKKNESTKKTDIKNIEGTTTLQNFNTLDDLEVAPHYKGKAQGGITQKFDIQDGMIMIDNKPANIDLDFIIDKNGEFKIGKGHYHLSMSSNKVKGAGQIGIKNGKIEYLDNKSGHYLPSKKNLLNTEKVFRDNGIISERFEMYLIN